MKRLTKEQRHPIKCIKCNSNFMLAIVATLRTCVITKKGKLGKFVGGETIGIHHYECGDCGHKSKQI